MARAAREKSSTDIYHVMLRGVNHQTIFEDDEDYQKLLDTLEKYQEESGYIIYAYCLMNNHLHLLIKEVREDLGTVFRRIGVSYVHWYNRKYSRRGHLFQDRYRSEVVENDNYFLTVIRYIHQNPYKAGTIKNKADLAAHRWNSYNEYLGTPKLCKVDFALNMFSTDRAEAVKLFKEFNLAENQDQCLDYNQGIRLNDIEATDLIKSICDIQNPKEIVLFEKGKRNKIIKECKDRGLSMRQIERLTGISFGVIRGI